jgi:hypothetical protein
MQILCLLGIYFDAVVVEVEKHLLFQIGSGHTVFTKTCCCFTITYDVIKPINDVRFLSKNIFALSF